ncbi:MAG: formylglycine-generating enzyme family protein [Anaerolineae bacterium]|nr:formylglycine-generating enzyme family protein [Anaerolineae bacterium]
MRLHRLFTPVIVAVIGLSACATGGDVTSSAAPTDLPTATATATPTSTPTIIPTPTITPTATATRSLLPTLDPKTWEGVETNDEWTPVIREFDGVPMALVPPGSFIMGTTLAQHEYLVELTGSTPDVYLPERPAVRQKVDYPFWIDMTEVTNAQFAVFLNEVGNQTIELRTDTFYFPWYGGFNDLLLTQQGDTWVVEEGYEDYPVVAVNWLAADAFCSWRNARLPTELEWEYAGRGPDSWIYAWGNEFISGSVANTYLGPAEIGSGARDVSWVGAWDMNGNAKEWVYTIFAPYPYNATDGRESSDNSDLYTMRVSRSYTYGGNSPDAARLASRGGASPSSRDQRLGFRCARDFDEGDYQ